MVRSTQQYHHVLQKACRLVPTLLFRYAHVSSAPRPTISAPQQSTHRKFTEIPAAVRWPLIGTKLDFIWAGAGKNLHAYIDGRHQQLGPVFREALGPADVVFVSCPSAMRELFKYEGKYPKHPLPEAWTMYNETHRCKRGLFFMDDDEWLNNRKLMNGLMLQTENQQPFRRVIRRSCDDLISELHGLIPPENDAPPKTPAAEIPDLITTLYAWSVRGVSAVVLGDNATNATQLRPLITELAAQLSRLFGDSAPLMSFPPQLAQRMRLKIWTDFERSVSEILAIANEISVTALRILRADGVVSERGADCLLAGMVQAGMPDDVIKRIFIDLILAAGDTTAYTTQWALYLLARHGNAQHSTRIAIQQAVCDMDTDNDALMETALIRGSVRETMRLYPMAFLIGRLMPVDAVIANFEIPKNTMVIASLYTAGRCDNNFPDAAQFMPERWARNADDGKYAAVNRPGASVPYALGARSCIGQKLANIQMHYLLTGILRDFELVPLNDGEVEVQIQMVMVPKQKVRIGIRRVRV